MAPRGHRLGEACEPTRSADPAGYHRRHPIRKQCRGPRADRLPPRAQASPGCARTNAAAAHVSCSQYCDVCCTQDDARDDADKRCSRCTTTAARARPHKKTVEVPRTPSIDPEKGLTRALKSIADEDFDQAYRLLTDVRKEKPSCPETLAALGWSAWRTGNLGTNAYDGPEDFLLLALTFDANHPKALEYYARIAIEKGETENARNRLLQLLKAAPELPWAQEALSSLSPKGKKSGMRLWPKS